MDDAVPQSLFVVVEFEATAPYNISIIQLDTDVNNHEYASSHSTPKPKGCPQIKRTLSLSSFDTQLNQKEYVAHFRLPQGYPRHRWVFSPPASPKADLYMLPDGNWRDKIIDVPLSGCKFNLSTKMCQPIKPPKAYKFLGPVVTVRGHIYFMTHPFYYDNRAPKPFFECYNPVNDSWKTLEPCPIRLLDSVKGYIVATVVLDDTILINVDSYELWAYNVNNNKWYPVKVVDRLCFCFFGRAVVVENTIYALTEKSFDLVLALSVESVQIGGDLVFKCLLRSKINVPGMGQLLYSFKEALFGSRCLVHLGEDKFCLVQSAMFFGRIEYQPIQVTIIKLKLDGEKSIVIGNRVHHFKIVHDGQFQVQLCFSLPEYKTIAFEKGKRFVFYLNPFPEDFASKQTFQEAEIVNLPKDDPLYNVRATSELVAKSNVAAKASTISTVTGHPSNGYAKPSFAPKASTPGDGAASKRSITDEEVIPLPHLYSIRKEKLLTSS